MILKLFCSLVKVRISNAVFLVFLIPINSMAELSLDPVVVSASRSPRLSSQAPERVVVLSRDMLDRIHARTVAEALETVPGVVLKPIHGKRGLSVSLQGMSSDQSLLLINGMPISAAAGSSVDATQVSLLDVERIEIMPGASSALYGSAAMGGVINVITRSDLDTRANIRVEGGGHGDQDVEPELGLLGERHVLVGGQYQLGRTVLGAGVDWLHREALDLNKNTFTTDDYDGDHTQLHTSIRRSFSDTSIHYAKVKLEHGREDWHRNFGRGVKKNKIEQSRRTRINAEWELEQETHRFAVLSFFEHQNNETKQLNADSSLVSGELRRSGQYQQGKSSFIWNIKPLKLGQGRADIVSGVDIFYESFEQQKTQTQLSADSVNTNFASVKKVNINGTTVYEVSVPEVSPNNRHSVEAYTQVLWPLFERVDVSLGVRSQYDSDFGWHTSPKLGLLWSYDMFNWQSQIRASVGHGYRVPDLKQRHYIFDHSIYGYKVIGNPNLGAETSLSQQLSLVLSHDSGFEMSLSGFRNNVEGLISTVFSGRTEQEGRVNIYEYDNIGNAITQGIELATSKRITNRTSISAAYTYTDAKDTDSKLTINGTVENSANVQLSMHIYAGLSTTVSTRYQKKILVNYEDNKAKYSPDVLQTDMNFRYLWMSGFEMFAGMDNILNQVRDIKNPNDKRSVEGRFVYVGAQYKF